MPRQSIVMKLLLLTPNLNINLSDQPYVAYLTIQLKQAGDYQSVRLNCSGYLLEQTCSVSLS